MLFDDENLVAKLVTLTSNWCLCQKNLQIIPNCDDIMAAVMNNVVYLFYSDAIQRRH